MKQVFLFFLLSSILSMTAIAQTSGFLNDESYLNKLSAAIRGIAPASTEYKELAFAKKTNSVENFFQIKRSQYLASSLHAEKMRWRLTELLKLKASQNVFLVDSSLPNRLNSMNQFKNSLDDRQNATDDLFLRIVVENKSWDQILTAQDYKMFTHKEAQDFNAAEGDAEFFKNILSIDVKEKIEKSQSPISSVLVEFPKTEGRIAGVLTSPRFFARYATTGVNKNRRRAAAIFRTFLCDSMIAAVPDPEENKSKIIDIQYPSEKTQGFTEDEIKAAAQLPDDIHGSQADCRSCHYKLDPMGRVFLGSPLIPSRQEWGGSLTYKNSQGGLTDIKVQNIHQLGVAITKQPEYVACQMKHFWEWFIGKDISLTPEILNELTQQFDSVNRRTNDFINILVQRPEFKSRIVESPDKRLSRKTLEIFQKCQSCHQGKVDDMDEPLLDLTLLPLGKNKSITDSRYWLERISRRMDLENGGRDRSMPPPKNKWSLTREELLLVKSWIEQELKK